MTLPQLLPAFLSGYLVIALHVLGDFGTVSLLRYETFSYAIYLQYSAAFDRVYAAWLALFLLLLTGSLLLLEAALLRRLSLGRTGRGAARTSPPPAWAPSPPWPTSSSSSPSSSRWPSPSTPSSTWPAASPPPPRAASRRPWATPSSWRSPWPS